MAADPQESKTRLLARLEDEERTLSAARTRAQERIDFFIGAGDPERAATLRVRERELSARRRELHRQIDELRGELA